MKQIEDRIIPTFGNIYVKPDPISNVIGVGLGGLSLEAPERHAHKVEPGKCQTGVVVAAGWDAIRRWPGLVGKRVAWPPYERTVWRSEGSEDRVHLDSIEKIICWFSEGHPDVERPLDEAWIDTLQARPNTLLVERVDPPPYRGSIVVPDGIRTAYRQSEAIIIAAGDGVDKVTFRSGRRLFLPAESNKRIILGKRVFYEIYPHYAVGIFKDEEEDGLVTETQLPDPATMMHGIGGDFEERFDEGDPRGPR